MKARNFLLLLSVCFFSQFALAQFTTVTGTVIDPNGLPYANGTVSPVLVLPGGTSPTLNGFAYSPPTQPTGLDASGKFTLQLADNNVLQPAGTKWSFAVCSAAGTVQPSIGKGPVCFSIGPLTVTGSTQSLTPQITAAIMLLSNASGEGALFNAQSYGVKADTQVNLTASFSQGSTTVSCVSCNFQPGDVGKTVWVSNGAALALQQSTITAVQNLNTITVSNPTTTALINNGTAFIVWGSDDTAALSTVWTTASAVCGTVQLPAGIMLTNAPQFNAYSGCGFSNFFHQPAVHGQGKQASFIVPTAGFNFAGCTPDCLLGAPFSLYKNFSIWGTGLSPAGCTNQTLAGNNGGFLEEMDLSAWCAFGNNSIGLLVSGGTPGSFWGGVEAFGGTGIRVNGQNAQLINFVSYGSQTALDVNGVGLTTFSDYFSGTTTTVKVENGASWNSLGDLIQGGNLLVIGSAFVNGMNYFSGATPTGPILLNAGGVMTAENSVFAATVTGNPYAGVWLAAQAGSTFRDLGGNTFNGTAISQFPTFVQSAVNQNNGTTCGGASLAQNTTTGSLLMALIAWDFTAAQTASVTDTESNAWTQVSTTKTTSTTFGQQRALAIFSFNGTGTSAHDTVTGTISSSANNVVCQVFEITGQWAVSPIDLTVSNTGASNSLTPGATLTPVASGEMVLLLGTQNATAATYSAGSGVTQTIMTNGTGAGNHNEAAYGFNPSSSAYTMNGTFSANADWAGYWISIRPALSSNGSVAAASPAISFSFAQVSAAGGTTNKASCWKADGKTLGSCSSVVAADGSCTCN